MAEPNDVPEEKARIEGDAEPGKVVEWDALQPQSEIEELRAEMAANREAFAAFTEAMRKNHERERREWEQRVEELRAARKEALARGDADAFDVADRALSEQQAAPPKPPPAPVSPVVSKWIAANRWYETDPTMRGVADALASQIRAERPDLAGEAALTELATRMSKLYPERVRVPRSAVSVERGGAPKAPVASPAKKGLTLDDLPANERQLVERMVRMGVAKSPEEYLKMVSEES